MHETTRGIRIDSYDYFGYLVPGMVAMVGVCTFLVYYLDVQRTACTALHSLLSTKDIPSTTIIISGLVLFALISYVMGHIAGTFSSMFYEKIFVKKVTQYPTNRLLNIDLTVEQKRSLNFTRYFYLFFITIQYGSILTYNFKEKANEALSDGVKNSLLAYTGTSDVFVLSMLLLLVWVVAKIINEALTAIPGQDTSPCWGIKLYQGILLFCCVICSLPMLLISLLLGKLLGMRDKFPDEFAAKIKEKYNSIFPIDFETAKSTEVWWSLYWYVVNRDSVVRARIDKFLSLYGFMRNLAFACWFTAVCLAVTHNNYEIGRKLTVQWAVVVLLLCSILFAVRFYYLYYNYYSKTIFRVFLYLDEVQPGVQSSLAIEPQPETASEGGVEVDSGTDSEQGLEPEPEVEQSDPPPASSQEEAQPSAAS